MRSILKSILSYFEKNLYKVLTETNKVFWVKEYSEGKVRLNMYQKVGAENFTIKRIK